NEGGTKTLKVVIRNPSQQVLIWHAETDGANWLTLGQSEGKLQPDETLAIDVSVDTSKLAVGHYEAKLTFTSKEEDLPASVQIPVILDVAPMPVINIGES